MPAVLRQLDYYIKLHTPCQEHFKTFFELFHPSRSASAWLREKSLSALKRQLVYIITFFDLRQVGFSFFLIFFKTLVALRAIRGRSVPQSRAPSLKRCFCRLILPHKGKSDRLCKFLAPIQKRSQYLFEGFVRGSWQYPLP